MPRLHVTEITSIGAVEDGDNPGARIMLFKRRSDAATIEDDATGRDRQATQEEPLMSGFDPAALEGDDATVLAEYVEAAVAKALEDAATPEPDPLEKAAPEIKAMIAKAQADRDELAKRLEAEITKRRADEFTTIAKQFAPVTGPVDEAAPNLAALEAGAPAAFTWLKGRLEAAKEQTAAAGLFKRVGAGDGDGDPATLVTAAVAKYREADPTLTETEARRLVWSNRPDLVEAVRSEGGQS